MFWVQHQTIYKDCTVFPIYFPADVHHVKTINLVRSLHNGVEEERILKNNIQYYSSNKQLFSVSLIVYVDMGPDHGDTSKRIAECYMIGSLCTSYFKGWLLITEDLILELQE